MFAPLPIICVAPMINYTDTHDRYFLRLIAPHIRLYTEMITTHALIHGNTQKLLAFHPQEKYLALQLGGSDPMALAECALLGENAGYDEINLNVGCPSPRVQSGSFGACLMREPDLVAECISAMQQAVSIPVTVKCRLGIDHDDSQEFLKAFIQKVSLAGCKTFIIHARKAWLSGLSPKENREIPPLHYDRVYDIKQAFPQLTIIINGGIKTVAAVNEHLQQVDGVMLGREAYHNPYLLAELENKFWSTNKLSRQKIIESLIPYLDEQMQLGVKLSAMTRHILGLYQGEVGAAKWRRHLSEHAHRTDASLDVLTKALTFVTGKSL